MHIKNMAESQVKVINNPHFNIFLWKIDVGITSPFYEFYGFYVGLLGRLGESCC